MDNANLENLVALGYNLGGLTSEEIDRINQVLTSASMDLNRMTEMVDNMTGNWSLLYEAFKKATKDFFPVVEYHYLKTTDFLLMGNKVTPRCIYLAYCRNGKVAKKNLNRIRR